MEFELVQSILTSCIVAIWYFASTLIIFDFLIGLPALMEQAAMKNLIAQASAFNQEQEQHLSALDTFSEGLNGISTRPISNADEATIEYLQMVGADISDFDSIAQARAFLDENAPWTIEGETPPAQTNLLTNNIEAQEKLTCVQVQAEFAKLGYFFEKYRTGHYRYRIKVNGLCHRFKTLQDALDWLDISKRLLQVAAK